MAVLLGLLVFVAAAALDFAYVRYQESVARGRARAAGLWSVLVYLVGSVGFLSVVESSWWYMLPQSLGLYAGTLIAVRRSPAMARDVHLP